MRDHVVVTREAVDSGDPYELISTVGDVVAALIEAHHPPEDVSAPMMRINALDRYVAQVSDGGHRQFLYDTPDPRTWDRVGEALAELRVGSTTEVFAQFRRLVAALPQDALEAFVDGPFFGDEEGLSLVADVEPLDAALFADKEALVAAQASAILAHDGLVVLAADEVDEWASRQADGLPGIDERRSDAASDDPAHVVAARRYCLDHGVNFERVTVPRPVDVRGTQQVAWHFLTDTEEYAIVQYTNGGFGPVSLIGPNPER